MYNYVCISMIVVVPEKNRGGKADSKHFYCIGCRELWIIHTCRMFQIHIMSCRLEYDINSRAFQWMTFMTTSFYSPNRLTDLSSHPRKTANCLN